MKAKVEKLWRDHFVIEEDMLEISGTNITPDVVLRASVILMYKKLSESVIGS